MLMINELDKAVTYREKLHTIELYNPLILWSLEAT